MVRRYEEPIEVRAGGAGAAGAAGDRHQPAPTAFVWRGRLYVVRDVLGHWSERRAWWRDALDPREEPAPEGAAAGSGADAVERLEQEVWRVEASPGRMHGTGVYDLARDRGWRLVRVAD